MPLKSYIVTHFFSNYLPKKTKGVFLFWLEKKSEIFVAWVLYVGWRV